MPRRLKDSAERADPIGPPRRSSRWRRPRWYEAAPEAVVAGGLGLFAITEPHAAASALSSGRAIALMAVVALGWVAARIGSFALVRVPLARIAFFGVAAVAILMVVVAPAYRSHTVVETLPARRAPAPSAPPTTTAGGLPPAGPLDTAPAALPVKVKAGSLRGIDHRASGSVNLYRQPGGSHAVGLEDFAIQPGPAYVVYIVPGSDRRDRKGGTRLDRLRGNKGTQYYDVPTGIDVVTGPWTVLVWCETFDVPVANATPIAT